jgi:hypothetical protein
MSIPARIPGKMLAEAFTFPDSAPPRPPSLFRSNSDGSHRSDNSKTPETNTTVCLTHSDEFKSLLSSISLDAAIAKVTARIIKTLNDEEESHNTATRAHVDSVKTFEI